MFKQKNPMKRTAWKKKIPDSFKANAREVENFEPTYSPRPLFRSNSVMTMAGSLSAAFPKDDPVRSESYRRLVAAMPCKICGLSERSQAAHPNTGKGQGIKSDDRFCFPLCADGVVYKGCHPKFDQEALYSREVRRQLENKWLIEVVTEIVESGQWPKNLESLDLDQFRLAEVTS